MATEPLPPSLLQRVERARRIVSHCSQAAIRAYDEEALLFEVCRALIDLGGYCFAWFGEVKPNTEGIVPMGYAGTAPSGVRGIEVPWTTTPGRRSPTMRAIQEQCPQVVRSISADPALQQRIPEAGPLGFASICACPIQFGPHGAGVLTIYAREPDAFAPEEVALLRELAGDLAVGVAGLRAKQASLALEERLEEAERRFRGLVDGAPVGILQLGLDGKVYIANQACADLLGYAAASELTGRTVTDLSRHLDAATHERVAQALAAGPPYPQMDLVVRRGDGTQVYVQVQAQAGNGNAQRTIELFARDRTNERAAKLAAARLAAVVNASDESIIGIDMHGVVQTWSSGAASLYGFTEDEVVGRALSEICMTEDGREEWSAVLAALLAGRAVERFETQRVTKTGEIREVSVTVQPILDADGQLVGASTVSHDVGERNRAQLVRDANEQQQREVLQLQDLNRMRAEFMSRASHELNTPLTPMLSQVQSLMAGGGLDVTQERSLAIVERNVIRLAALVKDLLTASTLTHSQVHLKPTQLDLEGVVAQAVESFAAEAGRAGVSITSKTTGSVAAFADGERIMQVLFNLIGNSLKFTPRGGSITVRATMRRGEAFVEVSDTGLGFADADRPNLFRPFGRLHEDVAGAPGGTGLGLFISKGIIEGSGGTMTAESPGRGLGCKIGFTLPARPPVRAGKGILSARGFDAPPESAPSDALGEPATSILAADARAEAKPLGLMDAKQVTSARP
ncbi:MAG: PAS domain S-box protein [bacterium]